MTKQELILAREWICETVCDDGRRTYQQALDDYADYSSSYGPAVKALVAYLSEHLPDDPL